MALKVALISMPFGDLYRPSLALTQLKAIAEAELGDEVDIRVHYLSIDFAEIIGSDLYYMLASDIGVYVTGFGEWLFRSEAFPDAPDNTEEYFARHSRQLGVGRIEILRERTSFLRERLPSILDNLIEKYHLDEADVVGFASMFAQTVASIGMARRLKSRRANLITIMGGANCEGSMGIELINHVEPLDFIFSGHSLVSFPKFLVAAKDGDKASMHNFDGVFSRQNSRSIVECTAEVRDKVPGKRKPSEQLIGVTDRAKELDLNYPIPLNYDSFLTEFNKKLPDTARRPSIPFETSRGCWWGERSHCTFCGLNGTSMAYRSMNGDVALNLMQGLVDRYSGVTGSFESADNIVPKDYFDEVFPKLKVPEGSNFFYEVKADLTDHQVKTLADAKVNFIQPGIEALSTSTLKLMKKGTTAFGNVRLLMSCTRHKVWPLWNLLVGFPGEGLDVYQSYSKMIPRLFHLPPPSGAHPVRFDRFSPYFTMSKEYGLDLKPYDFYSMCYPFPEEAIENLAYYFQDVNFEAQYMADMAVSLTSLRELISRWQSRWPNAFIVSPPRLELRRQATGFKILDERSGVAREFSVNDAEVAMLSAMVQPVDEKVMRGRDPDIFRRLDRLGLLISERGRVMSVVMGMENAGFAEATAKALVLEA